MGIVESVKNWMGYEDEYEEDMMNEIEDIDQEPKFSIGKKNKVSAGFSSSQMKIVVLKPSDFNSVKEIAEQLKMKKPVVIDVGSLDADVARRVIDFVSGTVCGIDGNIQRISGGIFIAAPANVDVLGQVKSDFSINKGYSL